MYWHFTAHAPAFSAEEEGYLPLPQSDPVAQLLPSITHRASLAAAAAVVSH